MKSIHSIAREYIRHKGDLNASSTSTNAINTIDKVFAHILLDKAGNFIDVSESFYSLCQFESCDLNGCSLNDIISNASKHDLSITLALLSEQHPSETLGLTLLKAKVEPIHLEASFTFMSIGGENRIYAIFKNVDLERNNVHELHSHKECYKLLAQNTSYVQALLDARMNCSFLSPSAGALTGYSFNTLLNKNLFKIVHPDDVNLVWETLVKKDLIDRKTIKFRICHANGHTIPMECDCRTIRDDDGQVVWIVLNLHDVTSQNKYEQELIEARQQSELSSSIKNDFLKLVSHELRTPLNAIIGFSKILEQKVPLQERARYLSLINDNGMHLLGMIDNILDFVQLNQSKYKLFKEPISLDSFFRHMVLDIKRDKELVKKENVEIIASWDLNANCPKVVTDILMLKKIFRNLLDNAFKFTKQGYVKYGCRPYGDNAYLFFVEDSGIGIPSGKHDIIFEKFCQMDQSNTREYGGIGIGLTVTKEMVRELGGDIWVESDNGKGASFYFTLPIGQLNMN